MLSCTRGWCVTKQARTDEGLLWIFERLQPVSLPAKYQSFTLMVGAEEAVANWTLMYQFVPLTFSTHDNPDDFNFRVAAPYIGVFHTVTLDVPAGVTNITVPISPDQGCLQAGFPPCVPSCHLTFSHIRTPPSRRL